MHKDLLSLKFVAKATMVFCTIRLVFNIITILTIHPCLNKIKHQMRPEKTTCEYQTSKK